MTRIAVLDDWQNVARTSADWSALERLAQVDIYHDTLADEDALVQRLAPYDILLTMRERTPFPEQLTARLPRLRMLNITGQRNNSVDMKALAARGVTICRTESGEGGEATAELALGLMIAGVRRIAAGDASARRGGFQTGVMPGYALKGRTLGVIGLGRLGSLMAGYGKELGMKVQAWSPNLTPERAEAAGVVFADKDNLLAASDVVSLHLVLSTATRGVIGQRELGLMKRGAVLVNTSRGPLVDERALLAALDEGRLTAALDVYEQEPLPVDHPLLSAPNTVLSPHLGYCVRENFAVFYQQSVENALGFLAGAPIRLMPIPT